MEQLNYRDQFRSTSAWNKIKRRLIYLPGAAIILYGFWLSLSA